MASNAPQRESLTHPESAALDFVLTLRKRWADTVYPALHDEYRERVGAGPPRGRRPPGWCMIWNCTPGSRGWSGAPRRCSGAAPMPRWAPISRR